MLALASGLAAHGLTVEPALSGRREKRDDVPALLLIRDALRHACPPHLGGRVGTVEAPHVVKVNGV